MFFDREGGARLCAPKFNKVTQDFVSTLVSGVHTHKIMSWNKIFSENMDQCVIDYLPGGKLADNIWIVEEFHDKFYVVNVDWEEIPPEKHERIIHHPSNTISDWDAIPYEVVITIAFVHVLDGNKIYFTDKTDTVRIKSTDIFADAKSMAEYVTKKANEARERSRRELW